MNIGDNSIFSTPIAKRQAAIARVSVIVPAYEAEAFVEDAIASIHAQTWPDLELIAVDDGSTDRTAQILEMCAQGWAGRGRSMTVIRQANQGAAAARNRGLEDASGEYIALFDADDLYHPDLIERQVSMLRDHDYCDLAFAMYRYVDAKGQLVSVQESPARDRLGTLDLLADNIVHAPLFKASILPETGGLDPSLSAHIDLDFFLRVTARRDHSIAVISDPLSDYRRHGQQITGDWRRMRSNHQLIMHKLIRRGLRLTPSQRRRIDSRVNLYWATLAYQGGQYGDARKLIAKSALASPIELLRDAHGRVRLAACLSSLLPRRVHDSIRNFFNRKVGSSVA